MHNLLIKSQWIQQLNKIKHQSIHAKQKGYNDYLDTLENILIPQMNEWVDSCDDYMKNQNTNKWQGYMLTHQVESMTQALIYLAKSDHDWEWSVLSLEQFLSVSKVDLEEHCDELTNLEVVLLRMQLKMIGQLIRSTVEKYKD